MVFDLQGISKFNPPIGRELTFRKCRREDLSCRMEDLL